MHQEIDRKRNKKEYRKLQLTEYEKTEKRQHYIKNKRKSKLENELRQNLVTDTGFDLICACCFQYKVQSVCKKVSSDVKDKYGKFIAEECLLLKNRTEGLYICNLCFSEMKQNKVPKRSQLRKLKFANLMVQ